MKKLFKYFIISLVFQISFGKEPNRKWNNPSSDFLLHEAGGNPTQLNTGLSDGNKNYDSQFPALGRPTSPSNTHSTFPTSSTRLPNSQSNSGKRDYVAPQRPTPSPNQPSSPGKDNYNSQFPSLGPQNSLTTHATGPTTTKPTTSGKRDYVAPPRPTPTPNPSGVNKDFNSQFPALGPQSSTIQTTATTKKIYNGKRDYVAPQFTTPKPNQGNTLTTKGNVNSLINFYENQGKGSTPPSYSNMLQGNKVTGTTPSTKLPSLGTQTNGSPSQTTKPSYSNIANGSNKPASTVPTSKPSSTRGPSNGPNYVPTRRPGSPVLPSSLNNNANANRGTGNGTTDLELITMSEELLRKDVNNAAKYLTVNFQEKTSSQSKDDKAPLPLLTISPEVWNIPTIQKFVPLLDNYERDTTVNEHVTPQERNEENAFMDVIMSTSVIRHLMNFLKDKGYVTPDPRQQRDFLKQLWFTLYSRGRGRIGSSGFEHIFVSELKNGDVSGLHNWIYFSKEESANRINYLGYLKYAQFGDKGTVLKLHFNQQGSDKPVDTMFIGTSPELEIALYTLCFVTRADNDCNLKLGGKDVAIVTHTFRYRSKNLIGSAYPQI